MNELAGQNLGAYRLEEEIGRGAMGVVYRGRQLTLGREVAIKVLPQELARDSTYVARFTREAKIMAGLNHPNIIQIYDAGRQNKHLYFVMEFIQGPTLANLLYLDGVIPQHLAVEYAAQIAEALDAAYRERNVIHRDIKPENLMLNRWGKIKVMDFGLARAPGLQAITVAQTLVGSIYYASPEQIWGMTLDNRSDIYALGVVLYEMVCGRRPFNGRSMPDLTQTITKGYPEPPRMHNPAISQELENIILTALARDRDQRFPDAETMAQELHVLALRSQYHYENQIQTTGSLHLPLNKMPRQQFTQPPRRPQQKEPITMDMHDIERTKTQPLNDELKNKASSLKEGQHNAAEIKRKIHAQPTVEMPSVNQAQTNTEQNNSAPDADKHTAHPEQKPSQEHPLWGNFQKKFFKPST